MKDILKIIFVIWLIVSTVEASLTEDVGEWNFYYICNEILMYIFK